LTAPLVAKLAPPVSPQMKMSGSAPAHNYNKIFSVQSSPDPPIFKKIAVRSSPDPAKIRFSPDPCSSLLHTAIAHHFEHKNAQGTPPHHGFSLLISVECACVELYPWVYCTR